MYHSQVSSGDVSYALNKWEIDRHLENKKRIEMKILVFGLGSMGKRRIRLLKMLGKELEIIGVDSNCARAEFVRKEYGITTFDSVEKALNESNTECAVISTSPLSHANIIHQCLQAGLHTFTELNLVSDMYEENIRLAAERGKVLFLSSTFLYRSEIQFIMDTVTTVQSKLNYTYHVGQYLPDWHPWENYKDFFVGNKQTNGCRELLAIELPWILKTFGKIKSFHVLKDKNTSLNIDYMDNYLLLMEHNNGNKGMLMVDVVSRKAVRNLEVFGEDIYLSWDGTPEGLRKYDIENDKEIKIDLYENVDKMEGYKKFVIENAYKDELSTFLDVIKGNCVAKYSFEEDFEILKLIDQIEGVEM